MRWLHGYLILCALAAAIVVHDLVPIAGRLQLRLPAADAGFVYLGFIVSLAVLGHILPGKSFVGTQLADGTRLQYKCNGLLLTLVCVSVLAVATWLGLIPGDWIVDRYSELFVAANLFALTVSVYLFAKGRMLRPKDSPLWSRGIFDDFVMGAELNPFIFGVNVKFFSYRPAMTGWLLINLSFLYRHYILLGFVTMRMLMYQLLSAWYIIDYFVHEPKMVSTWDIIAEHFGLMLVWGDYVFIVFAFSLQNFFLVNDVHPLHWLHALAICVVFACGFAIFRGANSQKHQFKMNSQAPIWGKTPSTVGGKLLVSGFWGLARHMNYTGDLLLALSFCMPCDTRSSLPYFYFIYLLVLIVHREKRDDDRCSLKYKELWQKYCSLVPYRMVPYVY